MGVIQTPKTSNCNHELVDQRWLLARFRDIFNILVHRNGTLNLWNNMKQIMFHLMELSWSFVLQIRWHCYNRIILRWCAVKQPSYLSIYLTDSEWCRSSIKYELYDKLITKFTVKYRRSSYLSNENCTTTIFTVGQYIIY